MRVFVGGAVSPERYIPDDDLMTEKIRQELSSILGIKSKPLFTIVKRYPNAMPQYHVGHMDLVENINEQVRRLEGLEVAGNAFGGVGMPDCINSGERSAERLLHSLFKINI